MGKAGAWEDLAEVCRSAGGSSPPSPHSSQSRPKRLPTPKAHCSAACVPLGWVTHSPGGDLWTAQSVQRTTAGILPSGTAGKRGGLHPGKVPLLRVPDIFPAARVPLWSAPHEHPRSISECPRSASIPMLTPHQHTGPAGAPASSQLTQLISQGSSHAAALQPPPPGSPCPPVHLRCVTRG